MLTSWLPSETRPSKEPQKLLIQLQQLRQAIYQQGQEIFSQWQPILKRHSFHKSALNLAYYLALRRHDLRSVQIALMPWGLSSLGRIEAKVIPNLDAVIATLGAVCAKDRDSLPCHPPIEAFFEGDRLLKQNTEDIFGATPSHRRVRIMSTLPTEAASNYELVKALIKNGADCVRINCAHDTASDWLEMITHVRQAEIETGRQCQVMMDLGGQKPRLAQVIIPQGQKRIFTGDKFWLARHSPTDCDIDVFQASCTIPEVLDHLTVGVRVYIDDGSITASVESVTPQGVMLRIHHTRPKGGKIRPDKGINFPDTNLNLSCLTDKDREDLNFIATHADIVGYSFVQNTADIVLLQQELVTRMSLRSLPLGLIAKIETPQAVSNLPELIVYAAGKQPFGVMIARGDLAVEIGYQRMAEMQEEILWLCEAAHVPVIWATQVLENLVKKGTPSRAEITDAAMAERAECVMLNKGSFLVEGVRVLDDVLTRMQTHQRKKTPQLRALNSW